MTANRLTKYYVPKQVAVACLGLRLLANVWKLKNNP